MNKVQQVKAVSQVVAWDAFLIVVMIYRQVKRFFKKGFKTLNTFF